MDSRPSELDPYPRSERDLGSAVLWERSTDRSHRRRERARRARRNAPRQKGATLAAGAAILATPVLAPLASAATQHPGVTKAEVAQKAATPRATPTDLLSYGDTGEAVAAVQAQLRIPDDGIYGPQTEGAVKQFQLAHELAATGVVDTKTWAELFRTQVRYFDSSPPSSSGHTVMASAGSETPSSAPSSSPSSSPSTESTGGPDLSDRSDLRDKVETPSPSTGSEPAPAPAPSFRAGHRQRRLHVGRADRHAGQQRHGHQPVRRQPRRPHPQRRGHRGPDRHHGARGQLRHGQHLGDRERLRRDGLRPACRCDHHVLRPLVGARRRGQRLRQGRPEDRRGRLHRQLHRPARALRGPTRRQGHRPGAVPDRRQDGPGPVRARHHRGPARGPGRHRRPVEGRRGGDLGQQRHRRHHRAVLAEHDPGTDHRRADRGRVVGADRTRGRPGGGSARTDNRAGYRTRGGSG